MIMSMNKIDWSKVTLSSKLTLHGVDARVTAIRRAPETAGGFQVQITQKAWLDYFNEKNEEKAREMWPGNELPYEKHTTGYTFSDYLDYSVLGINEY
jgi:hypothetical protein